jgi:hypothetical protein
VSHVDLTLSAWLDLSDEAAGRTAAAIARSTDARLAGIGPHAYAGRTGRVAFFDRDGVRYALVPGGTVQLGHDADRFVPSARQLADFAEAVAEYDLTGPLNRFVAEATSPPRHVFLPAGSSRFAPRKPTSCWRPMTRPMSTTATGSTTTPG